MIHAIADKVPDLAPDVFVAWNAEVAGEVTMGAGSSVWFGTTIRADICRVVIGGRTNLQDGTVVHVNTDTPTIVGTGVTVGHRAVLHGCVIGDNCLIGMGAMLLNGSEIGEGCIVAAGALVTQGKKFPPRTMIMGSPARAVREVTDDEYRHTLQNAVQYVALAAGTGAYRTVEPGSKTGS